MIKYIEMLTDEEAQIWAENYKKWKAKQPAFVAVEMSNEEMTEQLGLYKGLNHLLSRRLLPMNEYKLINGKLYKKSPNSYNQAATVIPW